MEEVDRRRSDEESELQVQELAYGEWLRHERERIVNAQFSRAELERKLLDKIAYLKRTDERFARMPGDARNDLARRMLHKDLVEEMEFTSFEEWRRTSAQSSLF